ncbi:MAG: UvrD-helicase domain-containing protein [Spirochaetaceae bacterium]|nr:UvrD-helicase domain-containing protein [Spirochaetaceae bacterium]
MTEQTCTAFKVLKKKLNEEQLKAVRLEKNAVVAAGAGSGKTHVLAFRFAYLVTIRNIPVENILALTFTDKAASEMYKRIYGTLKGLAEDSEKDESTQRAQKAVEEFHTARIQTLDSYCASIVKRGGRFFGISPDFTTDPVKAREFAEKNAIPFILKHRTNPSLQQFIGTKKIEHIAQELFASVMVDHTSLANPVPFLSLFEKQKKEIIAQYKNFTSKLYAAVDGICQNFTEITEKEKNSASFLSLEKALASIENGFSFPDETAVESFLGEGSKLFEKELTNVMIQMYTLQKVSIRSSKVPFDCIKQYIEELRNIYEELSGVCSFLLNANVIKDIMSLLEQFQEEFNGLKRMSGILTFKDVSDLALEILKTNRDIRETEKNSIRSIMIDEFQDDNAQQRDMLFLLAEKREQELNRAFSESIPGPEDLCPDKLFFVGDEKQSIYRFRGADVAVFRSLKEIFDSSAVLSTNFRSSNSLVAGFNSLFGGADYPQNLENLGKKEAVRPQRSSIFIKKEHLDTDIEFPSFEAEYTAVSYDSSKLEKKTSLEPGIKVCLLDAKAADDNTETEDDDASSGSGNSSSPGNENQPSAEETELLSKKETLAFFTAQKIRSLIDEPGGQYTYESFAILFRSYTNQFYYEKYLRAFGIPYVSESINSFFSDAPVNDIYALLRLILFPKDAVSYASVLHSPFVRMSHNGVNACLAQWSENAEPFSPEAEQVLETADRYFYKKGRERYERLCTVVKQSNVNELITRIWYSEGYRFETLWNDEVSQYAELYDFLFELARRIDSEGKTLVDFIDILDELQNGNSSLTDMDIPLERPGAVRLMSIHKSKGLEFPVVFVCGLSDAGKNDTNNEAVFFDKDFGVCINIENSAGIPECKPNYFFTRSRLIEGYMRDAELRRLLYVAMTRAEHTLYVTASVSVSKKAEKHIKTADDYGNPLNHFESYLSALYTAVTEDDAKGRHYLTPFFCKPNNTFAALLFPSMHGFIEQSEGVPFAAVKPFSIEEIPQYTVEYAASLTGKTNTVDKLTAQNLAHPLYLNIEEKLDDTEQDFHISPSSLHTSRAFINDTAEFASSGYEEIDAVISSVQQGKFGYEDFGTIAHAYAESIFTGMPVSLPVRITSVLTAKQLEIVQKIAGEMAKSFQETELGQKAKNALWRKNEYNFKMLLEKKQAGEHRIITGSIDLAFSSGDYFYIVDFKTDLLQDISRHTAQLALYRKALASIKNCGLQKIRCYLHYLRTNTPVDITEQTDSINIENLLFD